MTSFKWKSAQSSAIWWKQYHKNEPYYRQKRAKEATSCRKAAVTCLGADYMRRAGPLSRAGSVCQDLGTSVKHTKIQLRDYMENSARLASPDENLPCNRDCRASPASRANTFSSLNFASEQNGSPEQGRRSVFWSGGAENERRRVGGRGVWGHPPPEYFEIESLGNCIYNILR